MNTSDAIRKMLYTSGQTAYNVSLGIGKHDSYVYNALNRGSDMNAYTLSQVARVCGYRLVLDGRGEKIVIDAPAERNKR